MSALSRTIRKVGWGHWSIFTLCLSTCASMIWLKQIPEKFQWGSELGEFINNFCIAIVTAYVFFFLTDLRESSKKEHTYSTILWSPLIHLLECYVEYAKQFNLSRTFANGLYRATTVDYFALSEPEFEELVMQLFYDHRPNQHDQGFLWLLETGRGTSSKAQKALEQVLSYKSVLSPEIAKCVEEIKEGFECMADVGEEMRLYPPKYSREVFAEDPLSKAAGIKAPFKIGGYAAFMYRFVQANKLLFAALPLKEITPPVIYQELMARLKKAHGT